ncbi:hypothetical protein FQN49_008856, partial [Arthroderma sp. PD_2]
KFQTLALLPPLCLLAKYVTSLITTFVKSGIEKYILDQVFLIVAITAALYLVPKSALAFANNTAPPLYVAGTGPPQYDTQYAPVNLYPPQGDINTSTHDVVYDVPPLPQMGKPQELPGGYHPVVQQALTQPQELPSPRPYNQPAELPQQPYRY